MRGVGAGLLLAVTSWAASVSGTVHLQQEDLRRPLPGVRVTGVQADIPLGIVTVTTDAQGRYRLEGLARARVQIRPARPGYLGRAVQGGEPFLIVDLSSMDEAAGADFVLQPGGVITGRVTDAGGQPVEGAQVRLYRVTDFGGRHQDLQQEVVADDRGVYRAFGLAAGRYVVGAAHLPGDWLAERRSPVYYPAAPEPSRASEVEVRPGAEIEGIDLAFLAEPLFQVSGRIVGLPAEEARHALLRLSSGDQMSFTTANAEGAFAFPRLPRGTYQFTVRSPRGMIASETLDLTADITGRIVRPAGPVSVTGRLVVASPGARPAEIRLRLRGALENPLETTARPPEYSFQFDSVWPGPHTLAVMSPPGAYLAKARIGASEATKVFEVPPGGLAGLELGVGLGQTQIAGQIKSAAGTPLPHARVAFARSDTNPVEFMTVVADQNGRFSRELKPAEYLVGAWAAMEIERLYGPEAWRHPAVKRLVLQPGAQVELELTAVP